jgi:hypothetical protein
VFAIAFTARGSRPVRRKTSVGMEPIDGGSEIVGALVNKSRFLVLVGDYQVLRSVCCVGVRRCKKDSAIS